MESKLTDFKVNQNWVKNWDKSKNWLKIESKLSQRWVKLSENLIGNTLLFEKCEFCEKWYFEDVNFVNNRTLKNFENC